MQMQWTAANWERCNFTVGSVNWGEEELDSQQDVVQSLLNLSHTEFMVLEMLVMYLLTVIDQS